MLTSTISLTLFLRTLTITVSIDCYFIHPGGKLLPYHHYYGAVLPRRRSHYVSMLSVCLSVRPVPPPREKTKRPMNTKLGRKDPRDTSTQWTNFKVKGSKVKVTAANEIPF